MKFFISMISIFAIASTVHASELKLKDIKQIICQSTFHFEEETPTERESVKGIKIFTPGSRTDVKPIPGAFLLAEYNLTEEGGLSNNDNQQYYLQPVKDGKITFAFIADWKANGELNLKADNTATGFINQKTHITELSCVVLTK